MFLTPGSRSGHTRGRPNTLIVRGTGIQVANASSYVVSFPTGTQAGDFAIVQGGHGFVLNAPSGWDIIIAISGSNWNGLAVSRTLTAADIATGSVTVTTAGGFNGVLSIITFVGGTGGVRTSANSRNGSGATSLNLSAPSGGFQTDLALYFGSARENTTGTATCNQGTLTRQTNDTICAGVLNVGVPTGPGSYTATYSYSTGGTGNYQAIIFVKKVGG